MEEVLQQVIQGILSNPEETLSQLMQMGDLGEQLVQAVQQAAEEGNEEAVQAMDTIQLLLGQSQQAQQEQVAAARHGAKLNYIKHLTNQCPEGYELTMFKAGGKVCKKCMKKKVEQAACGKKMEDGGNVTGTKGVKAFKCGRKMKKAEEGVKIAKCGLKMKKALEGGPVTKKSEYYTKKENPEKLVNTPASKQSILARRNMGNISNSRGRQLQTMYLKRTPMTRAQVDSLLEYNTRIARN